MKDMKMVFGKRFVVLGVIVFCVLVLGQSLIIQAQDDTIDSIIDEMTLEHKIGQMFMVNLFGQGLTDAGREILEVWQPGAVVILDSNIINAQQVTQLTNTYQTTIIEAGGVPLFITTDQEGGIIARLKEGYTEWPVPMLLTATDDPDLAFRVGEGIATELRASGLNMNLAPVADLRTNLNNPIIGRRSPGSDPEQVGRMLFNLIEGMQSGGVMSTAKHFLGHGETNEDSHTTLPELPLSNDRLQDVELMPFVSAIDARVGAIMVSHIWYSAIDGTELPASLSYNVVTGLLREELGYDGIIVTDAMDMDAIDTNYSPETASRMAIEAGIDLIIIGANVGEATQARVMQSLVDAVRAGELDEAHIDDSVRRILQAKQQYGVLDWEPLNPAEVDSRMNRTAHAALIEEVFQAGISVAYDNNNILPLDSEDRVGIIYPGNRASIWTECRQYSPNIAWVSVSDSPTDEQIDTAALLGVEVDHVVVFTRDAFFNLEQQELVRVLPPEKTFVVALVNPFDQLRFPDISGYMVTYSPMQPAIVSACEILFGERIPRGTLSVDLTLELPSN